MLVKRFERFERLSDLHLDLTGHQLAGVQGLFLAHGDERVTSHCSSFNLCNKSVDDLQQLLIYMVDSESCDDFVAQRH